MTSLSMVLGKEAVVAYMVVLTFQGEIMKNYPKIYKRYGDAFKVFLIGHLLEHKKQG